MANFKKKLYSTGRIEWLDENGVVILAEPANVRVKPVSVKLECLDPEIDLIRSNWLPICVGGVQWYVSEHSLVANVDGSDTTTKIYKQGANGAITATAPAGVITEGYCVVAVPVVETEIEYVCNAATNVYDQIVIVTTDGVSAAPVITATTISCDEPKPDFEQTKVCDTVTGTYHIITQSIDELGVATTISDVDTGESCVSCPRTALVNPHLTGAFVGPGSVPAGFVSVTISNVSGINAIGAFQIGNNRRPDSITLTATDIDCISGTLNAIAVTGTGSWQYIGILPPA